MSGRTVSAISREVGRVRVLDVDPDLGRGLRPEVVPHASASSHARAVSLSPGIWDPGKDVGPLDALFLMKGLMTRRVSVRSRASIEPVGEGQLLRPMLGESGETVAAGVVWRVVTPVWAAVLDDSFWTRAAACPPLLVNLLDRGLVRARSLGVRLAVVSEPGLAERLRITLWHLADRHGRMTKRGVMLALPLSHEAIAEMVSASRPAVSDALKELERGGAITRMPGEGYLLHGTFEDTTSALHARAAGASALLEKAAEVASAIPFPL